MSETIRALESTRLLDRVSRIVDERVKSLEKVVLRLQHTKQVLKSVDDINAAAAARQKYVEEEEEALLPNINQLDDILMKAKEVRSSSNSSDFKVQTGAKVSSSLSSNNGSHRTPLAQCVPTPPPQVDTATTSNPKKVAILEQLEFWGQNPSATHAFSTQGIKDVYLSQAHFLSRALGQPTHPRSAVFDSVRRALEENQPEPVRETKHRPDVFVLKLSAAVERLVSSFNRYLKSKLSRQPSSQLSAQDKEELVSLWYRGRRLLQMYDQLNAAIADSPTSPCTCSICKAELMSKQNILQKLGAMIEHMPLFTPAVTPISCASIALDVPKVVKSAARAPKPKRGAAFAVPMADEHRLRWKNSVDAFHDIFQSRIMYLIEYAVGQDQLKRCIQRIKACCQRDAIMKKNPTAVSAAEKKALEKEWVTTLTELKYVHDILTMSSRSSCVILHKTSSS